MKNIIIGAGTFGTAIANELLSNSSNEVVLYSNDIEKIHEINEFNTNKKIFPNKKLHYKIKATSDM